MSGQACKFAKAPAFGLHAERTLRCGEDPEWRAQVVKDGMKLRKNQKGEGWVSGKFLHPHDACFDKHGNIFVAEWVDTGRITKLRKVG